MCLFALRKLAQTNTGRGILVRGNRSAKLQARAIVIRQRDKEFVGLGVGLGRIWLVVFYFSAAKVEVVVGLEISVIYGPGLSIEF